MTAPLETITLHDGTSTASIVPARGGLVSAFRVGDRDVLFLDPATLADPTKNVRGGIPILFPFAGKPPPGSRLKQHGFARLLPWKVLERKEARLTCALEANDVTRAGFPHDFRLTLEVVLEGPSLALHFTLINLGAEPMSGRGLRPQASPQKSGAQAPMPLHFGLHPYFAVPLEAKRAARIDTDATAAFNQRTGVTGPTPPIDFGAEEVDLHLLNHTAPRTTLHHARTVELSWSPTFTTLVVWTLPNQPFICVEPWSDPATTLGARSLAAGATAAFDFRIRAS